MQLERLEHIGIQSKAAGLLGTLHHFTSQGYAQFRDFNSQYYDLLCYKRFFYMLGVDLAII